MIRVWLIRHGEPVSEAKGRCYGSLDFDLSENGRRQIEAAADFLRTEPLTAIYTSPRTRSIQSANIIAVNHNCPVEVIPDFRELHFGDFEGLTYDRIAAAYPDRYRDWMQSPTQVRFPNGESFPDMQHRVLKAFAAIESRHENQTIAIVSHGGINRILIARALQIPNENIFRLAQDYAALNLLVEADGVSTVHLLNRSFVKSA